MLVYFWTKPTKKGLKQKKKNITIEFYIFDFQSKTDAINPIIGFCIFELVLISNFMLDQQF